MKPEISVIIPAYNVAEYLDTCLESIEAQTFPDFEVLIVDDGSTDATPQKCDAWASRDQRFIALHKTNGGVSSARNYGLDRAQGQYICFVDGDDYVESRWLELLISTATEYSAEITFCGYKTDAYEHSAYTTIGERPHFSFHTDSNVEFKSHFPELSEHFYIYPPWNKMYSADFIRQCNARFPEGIAVGEDSLFNFPLYMESASTACVPESLYHYVVRDSSASSSFNERWFPDRRKVYERLHSAILAWDHAAYEEFANQFIYQVGVISSSLYTVRPKMPAKKRNDTLRMILDDPMVNHAITHAQPNTSRNKITFACLRTHSLIALKIYSSAIGLVKRHKS